MFHNDIIMTTDIIIINKSVFLEKKNAILTDIVKSRYDDIYKTFQCFTSNVVITPLIINKHHEDKGGYKGNNRNKKIERREECYFSNRKKDFHKTIMGIFNVLNHDNYNKMLTKVRLLKTETNITFIINDLLNKCSLQIFYLNIYIKFLHDIEQLCTPQERLLVINCFNNYIKDFLSQKDWLNGKIVDSCADYSAFCDSQKRKSIIQAKNMILCHLFNLYDDLDYSVDSYIDELVNDLKTLSVSEDKDDTDEYNIILIVQMILDIIKSYKHYNIKVNLHNLIENYDDIKNNITNKKLKFLIEDLAKLF